MLDLRIGVHLNDEDDGVNVSRAEKRAWTALQTVLLFGLFAGVLAAVLVLQRLPEALAPCAENRALVERIVCQRDGIPLAECPAFADSVINRVLGSP